MEASHLGPNICCGPAKTTVNGDNFIDEELLKELRAKASTPQPHPLAKVPSAQQIEILKELFPKVKRGELAKVFNISLTTLLKWWRTYGN